jgi:hypothetical protein
MTAVEFLEEQIEKFHNWKLNQVFDENCFDEIELNKAIQQAKEMEKEQKGYSEEEVEKLIRITYQETMKAMVDWFKNNKDKTPQDAESAIINYVYPRLSKKGIKFKNK